MGGQLVQALLFTAAPVGAAVAGGVIAIIWPPRPNIRSYIQHLAAGVVFSALGVEVLPEVMHHRAPLAAAGGFAAGTALMLTVSWLSRRGESDQGDQAGTFSWSYVVTIGVDVLIDGLLLGIGFVAGQKTGKLLAIALAAEFFSLGLATAAELVGKGVSRGHSILTTTFLGLLSIAGVLVGLLLFGSAGGSWLEGMLAFAAAALLYLVTEELLVEAHKVPETTAATAMFFVGFLAILILDLFA